MENELIDLSAQSPDVEGTVKSIVFHNEENGYTIMQVETANSGVVTVLGRLPAVVQGEQIQARGQWKNDRKFGRQLAADQIHAVAPVTKSGIQRFLASGLIDGIGKTYAKRIVEKFGKETFRIIEEESKRLQEVEGIGASRRLKIKDSWKKQKSVRDIMIFLHEHGLSTARALRLYKTYGAEAAHILRSDPYRLARELPGVGFKTADDIASKMGQLHDSPQRLAAGILHVLSQAANQGHCALPRTDLIRDASQILEAAPESIEIALNQLILDTRIVVDADGSDPLVYSTDLFEAESLVAETIARFLSSKTSLPEIQADAALSWFARHHGLTLGEEQAHAVIEATRHRFYIITGGPGVGKTTILKALLEILARKKVHTVLCAPTGRAAKRLSESTGQDAFTIHRALEFQPEVGFTRNENKPLEGDLFIVDEASMIDIELMARFLAAVPPEGNVLLVGDVDQLPSVGPGNVLKDLIDSESVPLSRLTEIYRQAAESQIIAAAHEINHGKIPSLQQDAKSDFFFIERNGPEAILETVKHLVEKRIPEGFDLHSRDEIQVLTPMNKQSLGTAELNRALQSSLNPPTELKFEIERFKNVFRTGDKVIQLRNNYDKDVYNGDIGHIAEITTEPVSVYVAFEGNRRVHYEPGELDELQLAYAITIHKSQGSEFPAVVIPLASQHYMMLQRNLIYTAITRGKQAVIIVGEKKALESAVRNFASARRHSGLAKKISSPPMNS